MPFSNEIKKKVLLWADRRCCLCKRECGLHIEIHHIIPQKKKDADIDTIDNAIPLCFNCHGIVSSYNKEHPKGNKFSEEELKSRREQIYEEFTRKLAPPIYYNVYNYDDNKDNKFSFPKFKFLVVHAGESLPVKIKTIFGIVKDEKNRDKDTNTDNEGFIGHYSGEKLWNLNPKFQCLGHYSIPEKYSNIDRLMLRIDVTIIDQYERNHAYLPSFYVFDINEGWYPEF